MPLTKEDVEIIVQKYRRRLERRRNHETLWQDLADYFVPHRSNIKRRRFPGQKQTEKLFDSTSVQSGGMLAGFIHSIMTNPAIKWHSLKMRDESLNRIHAVAVWLEEVRDIMMLARSQSNFIAQISENYLDQVVFGTGTLFPREKPRVRGQFGGMNYDSFPISTYTIEENDDGVVDAIDRDFTLTARAAKKKWPDADLGEDIEKAINDGKSDNIFPFLHSIFPREKRDKSRSDSKNLPFASVVLTGNSREPQLVTEGGFHEFPVMVPRWDKTTGEVFGRGRGHIAMPDVKTLNKLVELELKGLSISITPPIIVKHDGVIGAVNLVPGRPTTVREDVNDIRAFDINPRLDLSTIQKTDLRESIRNIFFVNLLISREGGVITATEVLERIQEQQRLIGPSFGRQQIELLNPMIDREFGILARAGVLPDPPPEVIEATRAGVGDIDVEYEGPLARSQRSQEVGAVQRYLELETLAAQTDPGVIDILNKDEAMRDVALTLGLPASHIHSDEEIIEIRRAREEAQKEQRETENLIEGAKAFGAAAPGLELLQGGVEGAP